LGRIKLRYEVGERVEDIARDFDMHLLMFVIMQRKTHGLEDLGSLKLLNRQNRPRDNLSLQTKWRDPFKRQRNFCRMQKE